MISINLKSPYTWLVITGLWTTIAIFGGWSEMNKWAASCMVWAVASGLVTITRIEGF